MYFKVHQDVYEIHATFGQGSGAVVVVGGRGGFAIFSDVLSIYFIDIFTTY